MPQDPMAEIRASFFVECEELLESLHDALTALEGGGTDSETINVAFRAVHSIKGGAGAFGLTALVAFAHRFESVMDAMRSGRIAIGAELLRRLFQAADLLADEVSAARTGTPGPRESEDGLVALEAFLPPDRNDAPPEAQGHAPAFQPVSLSFDFDDDDADALPPPQPEANGPDGAAWTIAFRPTGALYASGNEPLLLLKALAGLGRAEAICDTRLLPSLDTLDPEESYLTWTIRLVTVSDEAAIRDIFDFVTDVAGVEVRRDALADPQTERSAGADPVPHLPTHMPHPAAASKVAAADLPVSELTDEADHATDGRSADTGNTRADTAGALSAPNTEDAATVAPATVRVDLMRIDRLVNLVGELVINQAMLAQSVTEAGLTADSAVMSGLDAFMVLMRDIQDSVMTIRAQPVKPLFQRMARILREASLATGKEVRLVTEGETTEIDKTVIERLADPLTHMIRNAVDHGLEQAEVRRAAGKPVVGSVTVSARHRSGRVVIDVADDGAGIDRARVLDIATRKGLVTKGAALSEAEIDALLFLPGFSTAPAVSNLSGRGVGMDVVKRAIQSLGGRIAIRSERGRGTGFSISLPLTLAVMDGMVIEVAGQTLVMPLSAIMETAAVLQADLRRLGADSVVACIRGAIMPFVDLGVELGFRAPLADYDGAIVLLTLLDDGSRTAFVVDGIIEQRQVVIKGLERSYGHLPGIAAATILGNGRIALILDPADIVQRPGSKKPSLRPSRAAASDVTDRPVLSFAG
jgi:two-component system, chemotaxis family, sensor kinase CheA